MSANQKSWQAGGRGRSDRSVTVPVPPPPPPKPGMLAPGYEKAFHKAVHAYANGDTAGGLTLFREAAEKNERDKALGDDFFAGLLSAQVGDDPSVLRPAYSHRPAVAIATAG